MTTSLPSLPSLFISLLLLMTACVEEAPEPDVPESVANTGETGEPPLDLGLATEPLDEYGGCKIGGCCDCNQVSSTGTQSCMSCSGAMSAADCGDQTYVRRQAPASDLGSSGLRRPVSRVGARPGAARWWVG